MEAWSAHCGAVRWVLDNLGRRAGNVPDPLAALVINKQGCHLVGPTIIPRKIDVAVKFSKVV
jgi:hypothetical protein